ncbi:BatD family protein [Ferrimonas lipolytica]|uniref:Protein BatD n=1 Tax=Ferrimonas lipolytica TaxID=2724191 RepID=A0A6H1UF55_9GAMM|nr:BatD family protein [Ferrimonas lipolytica]QIZ77230.1 protein BatD [Ferrimonas lipolytica]
MVIGNIGRRLLPFLLLFLISPSWGFTKLVASIEKNPVIVGQSFGMQITADDSINDQLDLTPLEQDFIIYRSRVSQRTEVINFDMKRQTVWTLELRARREGKITIPALTLNGINSDPINLTAIPLQDIPNTPDQPVRIETTVSATEVWLGQPIAITARLIMAAELQRGNLEAPDHPDVQIQQQGEDSNTTEIIDGVRVQVITRQYVAIPQRSGEIDLGSLSFNGDLMVSTGRPDLFSRGRAVNFSASSAPITLKVNAQPAHYQGQWLVADLATLRLDPLEQTEYEVGQPVTLTLRLTAMGAVAESLPQIAIPEIDNLRSYPDKPERQGGFQQGKLLARMSQTVALVPQQPGTYTIPEIRVPWWNARSNKQEFAVAPAQTITVVPSSTTTAPAPVIATPVTATTVQSAALQLWQGLTALFALLWLLTLIWGWRRSAPPQISTPNQAATLAANHNSALLQACRKNQAAVVINLLPRWASERHQQPLTLAEVAKVYPQLEPHIDALQRSRFSPMQQQWNGAELANAINQCDQQKATNSQSSLPALNPASTIVNN